jgi:hypothetical protein
VELQNRGVGIVRSAEILKIPSARAARLLARAMDEYYADHEELLQRRIAKLLSKNDAMFRTWFPRASGYVDENNVVHPPDIEAARLVARLIRDEGVLLGRGVVNIQNVNTGPVMSVNTTNIDARTSAAMIRESFPNGPRVILAEGQDVTDVPKLADKH